jgi:hypothetical protein
MHSRSRKGGGAQQLALYGSIDALAVVTVGQRARVVDEGAAWQWQRVEPAGGSKC